MDFFDWGIMIKKYQIKGKTLVLLFFYVKECAIITNGFSVLTHKAISKTVV